VNPRALVKEQFINDLTMRYEEIRVGHANKFEFVHGKVQAVLNNNSLNLMNLVTKQVENIIFDYLVIATGGSYNKPIRDDEAPTLEQRRSGMVLD